MYEKGLISQSLRIYVVDLPASLVVFYGSQISQIPQINDRKLSENKIIKGEILENYSIEISSTNSHEVFPEPGFPSDIIP